MSNLVSGLKAVLHSIPKPQSSPASAGGNSVDHQLDTNTIQGGTEGMDIPHTIPHNLHSRVGMDNRTEAAVPHELASPYVSNSNFSNQVHPSAGHQMSTAPDTSQPSTSTAPLPGEFTCVSFTPNNQEVYIPDSASNLCGCIWYSTPNASETYTDTDIKTQLTSSVPYIMIFLYMMQDFSFFPNNLYDCSNHPTLFDTSSTTSDNPIILMIKEFGEWYGNMCLKSQPVTNVTKICLKGLFDLITYAGFAFWYFVYVCCSSKEKVNKRKLSLIAGFIAFQLFIYQDLSEEAISLVHCVSIQGTKYLHIDATYICYQTILQMGVIIYLILCIVPFPLFVMFGPSLVRKRKINLLLFIIGMLLPGIGIIPCIWFFCKSNCMMTASISNSNHYGSISTNDSAELNGTADHPNEDDNCVVNESEKICCETCMQHNGSITKKILDQLQGHFRSIIFGKGKAKDKRVTEDMRRHSCGITWLGIILIFRLTLVWCSVCINEVDTCAFSLFIISLVRLFTHTYMKPYNTCALNIFYTLSLFLILVLAGCTLAMAIIESRQYANCATDPFINTLSITIDICTLYIPWGSFVFFLLVVCYKVIKHIYKTWKKNALKADCNPRKVLKVVAIIITVIIIVTVILMLPWLLSLPC